MARNKFNSTPHAQPLFMRSSLSSLVVGFPGLRRLTSSLELYGLKLEFVDVYLGYGELKNVRLGVGSKRGKFVLGGGCSIG